MPVILETHGKTYLSSGRVANPRTTGSGYKVVLGTAHLIKRYSRRWRPDGSDKLKVLLSCEGHRCEAVLSAVERAFFPRTEDGGSAIPPDVIIGKDWSLGDASSRRSKHGLVYTLGENIFPAKHCRGKKEFYVRLSRWLERHYGIKVSPQDLAWGDIEELDLECSGLKIVCAGRNEMECLGELNSFRLASAYLLDWKEKKAQCIVKTGYPLF